VLKGGERLEVVVAEASSSAANASIHQSAISSAAPSLNQAVVPRNFSLSLLPFVVRLMSRVLIPLLVLVLMGGGRVGLVWREIRTVGWLRMLLLLKGGAGREEISSAR
jgi:hypothetical protein